MTIIHRIKIVIIVIITLFTYGLNGCVFDEDEPKNPDRGNYTLVLSDSTLSTYPGGGDVIICMITPDEDFSGSVKLSVRSDDGINAFLNRRSLNTRETVTEIVIKPDSTLALEAYNVILIHTHGSTTDTLVIPVDLSDFVQPTQLIVARKVLDEFVSWIHKNYSSLESLNADNYHLYAISNMAIGGSGTWVAVNDTWELHFGWGGNRYGLLSRFLLRRMGEYKPSYYFLKESEREWFNDINVDEYFGRYSHSW